MAFAKRAGGRFWLAVRFAARNAGIARRLRNAKLVTIMISRSRIASLLAVPVSLLAIGLSSVAARAACPPDTLVLDSAMLVSNATARDTTSGLLESAYDLGTHQLTITVGSLNASNILLVASHATDDFEITGVPAGTVVHLTATLALSGHIFVHPSGPNGFESYHALLADDNGAVSELPWSPNGCCHITVAQTLGIPLVETAGQPFRLRFAIDLRLRDAESSGYIGQLTFAGLPPGAAIVGCQLSGITPVRRTDWGALKLRYR